MNHLNLDAAIRIYYECPEIRNAEIAELFQGISTATITRKKKQVKEAMRARGVYTWNSHAVNTAIAYEVWGMDIADLEKRREKLIALGMYEGKPGVRETSA